MASLRAILVILVTAFTTAVFATPMPSTFGPASRRTTVRRSTQHHTYRPVHPSALADYEMRGQNHDATISDYVAHGLGGLMHMVSREYGLRDSESFYWGPAGNPYANLTAYVGNKDVKVLSMERFQDVLDDAKCSPDSIKLTFKKDVQFDLVQQEWQWVNDVDMNYIVLVTENARCNMPDGDRTNRQPWHIKTAVFDDQHNVVTLSAQPKTWGDAFSHWHLRVSSKGIGPHALQHRNGLSKRIAYNGTESLALAATLPADAIPLTDENDEIAASIACTACYTTGSLDFDIDVVWYLFDGLTGTITMTPNDVGAYITTELELSRELTSPLSTGKNLLTYVPFGINIPGIITVGPAFKVDLAAGIDAATATIALSAGVSMTIPADAIAVLDFDDSNNNQFYNWSPEFTPNIPDNVLSSEVSVTAYAGLQLRVEFDIQIVSLGFAAGLALEAPRLELSLTGMAQPEGGVCDISEAEFRVGFGIALDAQLDGFCGFGAATDLPNRMPIASTSIDLYSTCMPVASGAPALSSAPVYSLRPASSSVPVYPSSSALPASSSAVAYPSSSIAVRYSSAAAKFSRSSAGIVKSSIAVDHSSSSAKIVHSSYVAPYQSSSNAPSSSYTAPASSSTPAASSVHVVPSSSCVESAVLQPLPMRLHLRTLGQALLALPCQ
ncbi:hypothetical protein LTR37_000969 [Vermiconidia calcicola]|uniref:Uncharacterized protein n=1 Tax=Vermiconidia calcicola TaxID=1690605 RepID=A0ACC3NXY7_9PEZI|nr:hypothetical protein LTR37_000969 [Vermiconidia calcicola]